MVYEVWKGGEMPEGKRAKILLKNYLGSGNQGNLGPENEEQLTVLDRLADPEFLLLPNGVWVCMDDRGRKNGIRLPGGLIWTEVVGNMMDPGWVEKPLSREIPLSMRRLSGQGEIYDHGDDHAHEAGCAAKSMARDILEYGGQNTIIVGQLALTALERLDLAGIIEPPQILNYVRVGQKRAQSDRIWDISPDKASDLIQRSGGKYHEFAGKHRTLGVRTNFSPYIFDNDALINKYGIGVLDLDFGPYKDHLENQGLDKQEVAKKVCWAAIFGYAASKILLRPDAVEIAVR